MRRLQAVELQDQGAQQQQYAQHAAGRADGEPAHLPAPVGINGRIGHADFDCGGKGVLEIGPGDGRLTGELLACGAEKVTAVEKDRKLVGLMRKDFGRNRKVEIVQGDILEYPAGRFDRIAGNIPYYISSPILFRLLEFEFGYAILCVQKEFGLRMAAQAGVGNYGRLSVMAQHYFEVKPLLEVPRIAFAPVPKVDSIVMGIAKKNIPRDPKFELVANALFQHRLKTVRASLSTSGKMLGLGKREARERGDKVKYSDRRVFSLAGSEIMEIAKSVL